MKVFTLLVETPDLDGPRVTVHRTRDAAEERLAAYEEDSSDVDHSIEEHEI